MFSVGCVILFTVEGCQVQGLQVQVQGRGGGVRSKVCGIGMVAVVGIVSHC